MTLRLSGPRSRRRGRFAVVAAAAVAAAALAGCSGTGQADADTAADSFPDRGVTLIVPFPAGGAADAVGRALVAAAGPSFPEGITVENRDGGAGVVGMTEVFKSDPDGYTLGLIGHTTTTLSPHTVSGISYDTPDDYASVMQVAYAPLLLVTRADAPWADFAGFVAAAGAGGLTHGSAGAGTPSHLAFEELKAAAGIDVTHVPFAGDAPALTALLGGSIDADILAPATVLGQVQSGDLKVLATFEAKRNTLFPDAPTVKEAGYDVQFSTVFGVYAPKGTPPAVVTQLDGAFKKAMETPPFTEFLTSKNFVPSYLDSAGMDASLRTYYADFGVLVDKLGLAAK